VDDFSAFFIFGWTFVPWPFFPSGPIFRVPFFRGRFFRGRWTLFPWTFFLHSNSLLVIYRLEPKCVTISCPAFSCLAILGPSFSRPAFSAPPQNLRTFESLNFEPSLHRHTRRGLHSRTSLYRFECCMELKKNFESSYITVNTNMTVSRNCCKKLSQSNERRDVFSRCHTWQ